MRIINKIKNIFRTTYIIASVTKQGESCLMTSIDDNIIICESVPGKIQGYKIYRKHKFNKYIFINYSDGHKEEIITRIKAGLYSKKSMKEYLECFIQVYNNVKSGQIYQCGYSHKGY